jgi:hypothetical protein
MGRSQGGRAFTLEHIAIMRIRPRAPNSVERELAFEWREVAEEAGRGGGRRLWRVLFFFLRGRSSCGSMGRRRSRRRNRGRINKDRIEYIIHTRPLMTHVIQRPLALERRKLVLDANVVLCGCPRGYTRCTYGGIINRRL